MQLALFRTYVSDAFFLLLQELTRLTGELPTELGNLENLVNIFLSKWMSLNQMYMMRKPILRKFYALSFAYLH